MPDTVYTQAETDTAIAAAVAPLASQIKTLTAAVALLQGGGTPVPVVGAGGGGTPAPTPTPSGTGIAAMTPGQWTAVPQELQSVVYNGPLAAQLHGNTGPVSIMSTWSGGAFDSDHAELIVWGGGHTDYRSNAVYVFEADTLTWAMFTQPDDDTGYDGASGVLPNGDPASMHTYDGSAYIPGFGFFQAGGASANQGDFNNNVWKLDVVSLKWTKLASPSFNLLNTPGIIACWDASTSTVVVASPLGIARYNPATNTWTQLGNGQLPDYHMVGAIDPLLNELVAVGGGAAAGSIAVIDLMTGAVSHPTTTGDQTLQNANAPGFEWYPDGSCFIGWSGGKTFYKLDSASWTWTAFTPAAGDTPTAATPNGTFGRFRYSASADAFLGVNAINEPVFILKGPLSLDSGSQQTTTPPPTNSIAVTHAASGLTTTFSTLQAAQPSIAAGDTVTISGGVFTDGLAVTAANVSIAVQPGVSFSKGTVNGGTGFFDISGAGCMMTALGAVTISGVHGDGTACGIRHTAGDLQLEGPWTISDCDNGIMSSPGAGKTVIGAMVTVEGCGQNVDTASPGHNLYLQGANATFLGTSSNAIFGGHELKVRSPVCLVQGALLIGAIGDNSRLIDFSNGGQLTVENCTLTQGSNTENAEMIGVALEGVPDARTNSTLIEGNMITTIRATSALVQSASPDVVDFLNNAVTASGTFAWQNGGTVGDQGGNTLNGKAVVA